MTIHRAATRNHLLVQLLDAFLQRFNLFNKYPKLYLHHVRKSPLVNH